MENAGKSGAYFTKADPFVRVDEGRLREVQVFAAPKKRTFQTTISRIVLCFRFGAPGDTLAELFPEEGGLGGGAGGHAEEGGGAAGDGEREAVGSERADGGGGGDLHGDERRGGHCRRRSVGAQDLC